MCEAHEQGDYICEVRRREAARENLSFSARKKHTFVYQDNVCFFQLNPPMAEEIPLAWDEIASR